MTLDDLQLRLAQDMAWLNLPARPWVPARSYEGAPVLDVAIVGAGMLGLTATAALRNLGVSNIKAFDTAPNGFEGPWITSARMETLRTRKDATGPALNIPSLTFRAWYEATHGEENYARMELAPRKEWMDYLNWYRRMLALPVENETTIAGITLDKSDLIALRTRRSGRKSTVFARRVVLATGIDGLGAPGIPDLAKSIPSACYAHSSSIIDMDGLAGKRVAVVGAGASAMDNAAAALEAGAQRVDIFVRRDTIPRIDKFTGVGSRGMTHGYLGLPDAIKWQYMVEGERAQIPPPRHSVLRVSRHPNAHFHMASPLVSLRERDGAIAIETPKGLFTADFIIFATGFSVNLARRPELASLTASIQRWGDVYAPPAELAHDGLAEMPYLGPGFEFIPRPGAPAGVSNIYCFAYPAVPSHGKITSGIPSIGDGAARLSLAIARSLFVEDRDVHLQSFLDFNVPELLGDEWIDAEQKEDAL